MPVSDPVSVRQRHLHHQSLHPWTVLNVAVVAAAVVVVFGKGLHCLAPKEPGRLAKLQLPKQPIFLHPTQADVVLAGVVLEVAGK